MNIGFTLFYNVLHFVAFMLYFLLSIYNSVSHIEHLLGKGGAKNYLIGFGWSQANLSPLNGVFCF